MTAQFHLDQDVDKRLKEHLNVHYGNDEAVKTAAELGLHRSLDGHHLLAAAQAGRIFVTHNGKNFITMQDAWVRWSGAWGVTPMHAGILIISQGLTPLYAAREIAQFLGNRVSLPNEIYAYDADPNVQRWVRDPVPKRR